MERPLPSNDSFFSRRHLFSFLTLFFSFHRKLHFLHLINDINGSLSSCCLDWEWHSRLTTAPKKLFSYSLVILLAVSPGPFSVSKMIIMTRVTARTGPLSFVDYYLLSFGQRLSIFSAVHVSQQESLSQKVDRTTRKKKKTKSDPALFLFSSLFLPTIFNQHVNEPLRALPHPLSCLVLWLTSLDKTREKGGSREERQDKNKKLICNWVRP